MANCSANSIVHTLVLSEFDLTRGSIVKWQYPAPIPDVDSQYLAEQMLPDGAHNREEDTSWFFLNRGNVLLAAALAKAASASQSDKGKNGARQAISYGAWEKTSKLGDILVFNELASDWSSFNKDNPVAVIRVVTDNSTTHAFCILLAHDNTEICHFEFNDEMQYTKLEATFVSVYSVEGPAYGFLFNSEEEEGAFKATLDEAVAEKLSREGGTKDTSETGKAEEETAGTAPSNSTPMAGGEGNVDGGGVGGGEGTTTTCTTTAGSGGESRKEKELLYCLNLVKTKKDPTVPRGAIVKALAVCTPLQYVHVFKPVLEAALETYFQNETIEVLGTLYEALNNINLSGLPHYSLVQRNVYRLNHAEERYSSYKTTVVWKDEDKIIPLSIPLTMQPGEVLGADEKPVTSLLNLFKDNIMIIFNMLLLERRVLFLGYEKPAGDICKAVFGACRLVQGLPCLLERTYPYANLVHLEFLTMPGYIAGVANPMFAEKQQWWDCICDLESGKVTINPALLALKTDQSDKHASYDQEFVSNVLHLVNLQKSEDAICAQFWEYTRHILELEEEEFPDDSRRTAELKANAYRLSSWRKTLSYQLYAADKERMWASRSITGANVYQHVKKLRARKNLTEAEVSQIFLDFVNYVQTDEQLMELLSFLPDSLGPIALGLFHSSEKVRLDAVTILKRLDTSSVGVRCIDSLNFFLLLAFERISRQYGVA